MQEAAKKSEDGTISSLVRVVLPASVLCDVTARITGIDAHAPDNERTTCKRKRVDTVNYVQSVLEK